VGEVSKGRARRLGLAQALINDPEFLILDEPTSGLDPIGTRQVKDLLVELGRRGKTILLSSHLLADVEDVCHRMVVLYGGRIRASGTGDSLLQDTDRTVIETRRLPPDVVEHVRRALAADGVSLDSVHAPRQRLEDLFMRIVEQARAEQASTSGALHGGRVAQFLAAETEGRGLVQSLAEAPVAEVRAAPMEPVKQEPAKPDLSGLLEPQAPAAPAPPPSTAKPQAPKGPVDRGLLDRLVDGDEDARP
jgi:ABC-2 type transport system ATP-binding protein